MRAPSSSGRKSRISRRKRPIKHLKRAIASTQKPRVRYVTQKEDEQIVIVNNKPKPKPKPKPSFTPKPPKIKKEPDPTSEPIGL